MTRSGATDSQGRRRLLHNRVVERLSERSGDTGSAVVDSADARPRSGGHAEGIEAQRTLPRHVGGSAAFLAREPSSLY